MDPDLIQTAISILAIAALAGVGLQRGKVTNLRDSLKDARDEITDKDRRLSEAEAAITKHTADLEALSRVVTGETHWVALGDQLNEHHEAAMEGMTKILSHLESRPL